MPVNNTKNNRSKIFSNMPMWAQLAMFISLILFALTFIITLSAYKKNRTIAINEKVDSSNQILMLKSDQLDTYLSELSNFSIQPCYDNSLYRIVLLEPPFSFNERQEIFDMTRTYFYARSDINSYSITLINQGLSFVRNNHNNRVHENEIIPADIISSEAYKKCQESPDYFALTKAESEDSLFSFHHAIIHVPDKSISSLVSIDVDKSELGILESKSEASNEVLCLVTNDNNLLYSGNENLVSASNISEVMDVAGSTQDEIKYIDIAGVSYLITSASCYNDNIRLISLLPVSEITDPLKESLKFSLMESSFFMLVIALAAYIIIRNITYPLTELSNKQLKAGSGDFSSINISGSKEISNLNNSFNEMTEHIEDLIKENYIAKLNEKESRLIALEAQVNPHFLYNTLQAIGSEALVNDQPRIYDMLVSLASNLRYSIKADNIVTVQDEMQYVDNYLKLQKMRLGDKLTITKSIAPETLNSHIPKISIQLLVENSIIHGIGGKVSAIHLQISTYYNADYLVMKVTDDGQGIDNESLENIRKSFAKQTLQDSGEGIGLANLYRRVRLMYEDDADILIKSPFLNNKGTAVMLVLSRKQADKRYK